MSTAPRQLLPRAERQAAILRGAARAFAEAGYADTSMEDVAAASGITKLIVYRHFESKEELYRAILQRVTDRLTEEFMLAITAPNIEGAGVRTLLTVAREDPAGFVLLWRHAAREPRFAEYADEIRDRAMRASEAFLAGVPLERRLRRSAAGMLTDAVTGAVLRWLDEGAADRDDEFAALVARGLTGMVRSWTEAEAHRPSH